MLSSNVHTIDIYALFSILNGYAMQKLYKHAYDMCFILLYNTLIKNDLAFG